MMEWSHNKLIEVFFSNCSEGQFIFRRNQFVFRDPNATEILSGYEVEQCCRDPLRIIDTSELVERSFSYGNKKKYF